MKLPTRIIDISQPLDNETVVDPDFMRPSVRYISGRENAALMCDLFPGLKEADYCVAYCRIMCPPSTSSTTPVE